MSVVVDEGAFLDMARHCLVPWKASSECVRRDETRGVWLCNKNRRVCESSLQSCKYVSGLSPTRGSSVSDKRGSREAKYDREFALRNWRNTSSRVIHDQSVAAVPCGCPRAGKSRRVSVSVLSMMRWYAWSTSGSEVTACRDALGLAEYTRAVWCQVVIGWRSAP